VATTPAWVLWARSGPVVRLRECESSGDYSKVQASGRHRGAYQADADFWRTYGGLKFAATAEAALPWQQDLVAYRGWLDRGFQPWTCRWATQ
jgi:hypothetical protein